MAVIGADELDKAFTGIQQNVKRVRFKKSAEIVAEEIRQRAPYDPQSKNPVHLRDTVRAVEDEDGARVEVGSFRAKFLEFGTAQMAARPFIGPGADAAQERAESSMGDELDNAIQKGWEG